MDGFKLVWIRIMIVRMDKWIRTVGHRPLSIVGVPILGFLWQPANPMTQV